MTKKPTLVYPNYIQYKKFREKKNTKNYSYYQHFVLTKEVYAQSTKPGFKRKLLGTGLMSVKCLLLKNFFIY